MSIIRRVDSLGRVTLPISYRRRLGIEGNSDVTLDLIANMITIEKCNSNFNLDTFMREFVAYTYGNHYQDLLVSKSMKKDISIMLKGYFDDKLSK